MFRTDRQLICANCRRPLSATTALKTGKLCNKCNWAASSDEFSEDVPTVRRTDVPALDVRE
jgi:hypothetical protein